jgi:single-strand DNA-binding protein
MASFNKIVIVGYLGRDPQLRYTPQGTAVCDFSVATTEKRKDRAGEPQDVTTWFRVTAWGRQAEVANEYLAKGRQVYVEGRLRLEPYIDREGNQRSSLEVNATDIHFLGQRDNSTQPPASANAGRGQTEDEGEVNAPAPARASRKFSKRTASKETVPVSESDDEIPF